MHFGRLHKREIRRRLLKRDGDRCSICGKKMRGMGDPKGNITIDHLLPKSLGGTNDLGNLRLAHEKCNQEKGNGGLVFINHEIGVKNEAAQD